MSNKRATIASRTEEPPNKKQRTPAQEMSFATSSDEDMELMELEELEEESTLEEEEGTSAALVCLNVLARAGW